MASVSHRPQSESTPPLDGVPIGQLVSRIAAVEGWLVDLAAGTPGAIVDGIDPKEIDRVARRYLARLRAELVRREFAAEVAS